MSEQKPVVQSINGVGLPRLIVVQSTPHYTSSGATTFTSTTVQETGVADWLTTPVRVNMRVASFITGVGDVPDKPTYAKVTALNGATLVVDDWTHGTPSAGQTLVADGWVADLPRTQEMTEIFTPDQLVHRVYPKRIVSKFFGWRYASMLDYSRYISADSLLAIRRQLTPKETDRLVLIPHRDKKFQYNVQYMNPVELTRYGISKGHKKVVLAFEGKELVSFPMSSGYGLGYATNFGNQY